jgi:glutathione peroxidase
MRIIAMLAALFASAPAAEYPPAPANPASVLDFTLTDNAGKPYPLAQHRGQVLLIVNVASRCGFTKQYAGLQALYAKHQAQGLVVIGVPANDFLRQEPGTDAEIAQFCSTKFGVTFPLMAKTVVKGDGITPLYAFLTTKGPEPGAISWNFNKYLIGRDGVAKARFGSRTAPDDEALVQAIERELAATP